MKYIRTKNGIYEIKQYSFTEKRIYVKNHGKLNKKCCLKQANSIEELCDVLIIKTKDYRGFKGKLELVDLRIASGSSVDLHDYLISQMKPNDLFDFAYLGIETDKGLIYVAKMNEKGELELL